FVNFSEACKAVPLDKASRENLSRSWLLASRGWTRRRWPSSPSAVVISPLRDPSSSHPASGAPHDNDPEHRYCCRNLSQLWPTDNAPERSAAAFRVCPRAARRAPVPGARGRSRGVASWLPPLRWRTPPRCTSARGRRPAGPAAGGWKWLPVCVFPELRSWPGSLSQSELHRVLCCVQRPAVLVYTKHVQISNLRGRSRHRPGIPM